MIRAFAFGAAWMFNPGILPDARHRPATGAVGFGPGHKRGEEGNEQNEKKPLHPAFIAIPAQFRDARHNAEPG
jgi:hypothetical protein